MPEKLDPIGGATRTVQVLSTTVRVDHLTIDRPKVAAYLANVPPDKAEIALVHAIEVGITELCARRDRFNQTI